MMKKNPLNGYASANNKMIVDQQQTKNLLYTSISVCDSYCVHMFIVFHQVRFIFVIFFLRTCNATLSVCLCLCVRNKKKKRVRHLQFVCVVHNPIVQIYLLCILCYIYAMGAKFELANTQTRSSITLSEIHIHIHITKSCPSLSLSCVKW